MTIVPEDFRVPSFGRSSLAESAGARFFAAPSSLTEEAEEDDEDDMGLARGSAIAGMADGGSVEVDIISRRPMARAVVVL